MSRCAHRKSTYKLQELPRCKKCRSELIYVMAKYSNERNCRWEWECLKCHKVYPEKKIQIPELNEQDEILHKRVKGIEGWREEQRQREKLLSRLYAKSSTTPN